jgi:hypothetical protein
MHFYTPPPRKQVVDGDGRKLKLKVNEHFQSEDTISEIGGYW